MRSVPPMVLAGWIVSFSVSVATLIPSGSPAAEPRAALRGPSTARAGEPIFLSASGTVSDEEPIIKLAEGPPGAEADVGLLYTREGKVAYGIATAPVDGDYWFALLARGTPSGADKPTDDFALWRVIVRPQDVPPRPPEPPPGPVDPDPGIQEDPPGATPLGFSRAAWEAKASCTRPRALREREARAIAGRYIEACSTPGLATAEAVKGATHRAAWAALGRDEVAWGAWRPVFARMVEALNSWAADLGRLPTADEMKAVYLEIADGYRRAKR